MYAEQELESVTRAPIEILLPTVKHRNDRKKNTSVASNKVDFCPC